MLYSIFRTKLRLAEAVVDEGWPHIAAALQLLSPDEAIDLIWSVTGPESYIELVFERGWSPDRYESWLADALRVLVLS